VPIPKSAGIIYFPRRLDFSLKIKTLRRKRDKLGARVGLDAWPQDGTRHTWASAWLRQYGDINKLVLQAGHDSPTTMWNHYYQAMTLEDAAAFWGIYPPARETRQIIPFQT